LVKQLNQCISLSNEERKRVYLDFKVFLPPLEGGKERGGLIIKVRPHPHLTSPFSGRGINHDNYLPSRERNEEGYDLL